MERLRRTGLAASLTLAFALGSSLPAQRAEATFAVGRDARAVVLDHGTPAYGRHSLDELAPGASWRLGMNNASTITTAVPLIADGRVVAAPGEYRVGLTRLDAERFALQVEGAPLAVRGQGSSTNCPGTLQETKTEAKKLEIRFTGRPSKSSQEADDNEPPRPEGWVTSELQIAFGPYVISATIEAPKPKAVGKVKGYTLESFAMPSAIVERSRADGVAIARLVPKKVKNGEPAWFNLVIRGDAAHWVPAMIAPEEQNGFGPIAPPDAAWTFEGEAEWADSEEGSEPAGDCQVTAAEIEGESIHVTWSSGSRVGQLVLPIPTRAQR